MVWGIERVAVIVGVIFLVAACGGDDADDATADDRSRDASTTTYDPRVEDPESEDSIWTTGSATLQVGGDRYEFVLDFCATQPVDDAADTTTITLQVDGTESNDPGITLSVVESVSSDPVRRIQTVSVGFEDAAGNAQRAWEAQRVVDPATGEVDDLHGDGTTPLFDIVGDDTLTVDVSDAAFWQFDMTGGDDNRLVGQGTLSAECRA